MKGLIALDIDGTVTSELLKIPDEVVHFLEELYAEGWPICLVTGRSFHFALPAVERLSFHYYLAVLNGAIILEMPERRIVKRHYIDMDIVSKLDSISIGYPTDFVIYSGFENGDISYYRPDRFSDELKKYVEKRAQAYQEILRPVDDFASLDILHFPSIKCMGPKDVIQKMSDEMIRQCEIAMPVIRDPLQKNYYVGLGTHSGIDKGKAITDLKELLGIKHRIIAAGDDLNDLPLLQVADTKIVMESAPEEMHGIADIIARPATENGIIEALKKAMRYP